MKYFTVNLYAQDRPVTDAKLYTLNGVQNATDRTLDQGENIAMIVKVTS